jgi:hypothetical protein
MEKKITSLNRGEKILLFLYELGGGRKKRFLYEDIVVGLFKKYPNDFCLKGYPEYPDSSDSSQRLLYEFKKRGYITVANKIFSLTDSGIEFAENLSDCESSKTSNISPERLSRATTVEIERIKNLEGFVLFLDDGKDKITESDLYNYFGVSVKTSKSAFSGRIKNIEMATKEIKENTNNQLFYNIIKYHEFLVSKYKSTLDYFLK